ncbi:hypothetical protein KNO81_42180, partial [Paraburkholderia sediminicola]|nr:hypothetical protein [Paraburkholderia sediminicola]
PTNCIAKPGGASRTSARPTIDARRLSESTGVPHHVDHIVPLQGRYVFGLHVENNLRLITAEENLRKFNRLIEGI